MIFLTDIKITIWLGINLLNIKAQLNTLYNTLNLDGMNKQVSSPNQCQVPGVQVQVQVTKERVQVTIKWPIRVIIT